MFLYTSLFNFIRNVIALITLFGPYLTSYLRQRKVNSARVFVICVLTKYILARI